VQFKDLRPAATPRPANFIRSEMPAAGKLILWEDTSNLRAGLITDTNEHERTLSVHEYAATTKTSLYWLPLWTSADGKHFRAKKQPLDMIAKSVIVNASDVQVTGELTATHTMSSATRKEALAKMMI